MSGDAGQVRSSRGIRQLCNVLCLRVACIIFIDQVSNFNLTRISIKSALSQAPFKEVLFNNQKV